jgi:hypothetical protein
MTQRDRDRPVGVFAGLDRWRSGEPAQEMRRDRNQSVFLEPDSGLVISLIIIPFIGRWSLHFPQVP